MRLHLTTDEFYDLTLWQLELLLTRQREMANEASRQQELHVGILASTMANFSMARPKEPFMPSDFMPSRQAHKTSSSEMTPERRKSVASRAGAFFSRLVKIDG